MPHHLLVTTPSCIIAWDAAAGLQPIFTSSKRGIVAAKVANDGSGMLAVAGQHVVVLHDTKRGQEHSWGLRAEDDEVRYLEYTPDARCLFLSSTLTNDIQRYSTECARVLSPAQAHHSAPTALAVSSTGQLMVSASDHPPTIYLKDLHHNGASVLIQPRASDSAVCAAAFHPERPNIFLLAFKDGTLAAYDGSRISRKQHGPFVNQEIVNDGEIAHFTNLHRTTAKAVTKDGISTRAASIAGATFLQGYKSRAITVGSDGRCRLVDFADGGIILRTWHARAPLTSVSVLSIKSHKYEESRVRKVTGTSSRTIGGHTSTNNLIAVGRADGKVHIYDSVGLLLAQKTISDMGERVISVGWAKGPSPHPVATNSVGVRDLSDAPTIPLSEATATKSPLRNVSSTLQPKSNGRRSTTPLRGLGLPPALRRPDASAQKQSARGNRRFTIHPDEVEEGTVRHIPSPVRRDSVPRPTGGFSDLFSPVKSPAARLGSPEPVGGGLPRARPRISSQTFIKSPEPTAAGPSSIVAKPRNATFTPPAENRRTIPGFGTAHSGIEKSAKSHNTRRISTHTSPFKKPQVGLKPVFKDSPLPNDNAKVLADLRKMSGALPGGHQGSVLGAFAGPKPKKSDITAAPPLDSHPPPLFSGRGPGKQKGWHPGNVMKREITWLTDSVQSSSLYEKEHDIWFTEESEDDAERNRRRRPAPAQRPPARQTSRSRVGSKGTYGTLGAPAVVSPTSHKSMPIRRFDGSTEEDMYATACTNLSPHGHVVSADAFSPSSADVRGLFPRTSSLSPKRKRSSRRKSVQRSPVQRSPVKRERALQEITGNTLSRANHSPWVVRDAENRGEVPVKSCAGCGDTAKRLLGLTEEVSRLRGEMLALKAALRRSGVPLPPSVRA
ncbi:hypothetical protein LTR08_005645 [Meristemomyces frigidus]|nr:hypothetical protein LTR08_005645 [Meristemomyces frigidus]